MKKIFFITFILSLFLHQITAQTITQKDNSYIDNLFLSNLVINKQKIDSDTLAMVFKGAFYMVDPKIQVDDETGTYSCRKLMSINEGAITEIIDSSIVLLVQEDFRLKTDEDATIVETALDKLYPIIDPEDQELKAHLKSGNIWYFIRGEFFDSKSAFKVTVDKDTRITGIVYDLKAIKGE